MIIEDLIILGRSAPDRIRDGRITCCTAGYSPSMGLIRIYPTNFKSKKIKRWAIISVKVKKNQDDFRRESFKIEGAKKNWENFDDLITFKREYPKEKRKQLIKKIFNETNYHCPSDLNDKRLSLGLVKPKVISNKFKKCASEVQKSFDNFISKNQYPHKLYIQYRCSSGCKNKNPHDQQVLEYGVYEWMRKSPDKVSQAVENLHLNDENYEIYFLIGNSYRAFRSFMIISILRFKK